MDVQGREYKELPNACKEVLNSLQPAYLGIWIQRLTLVQIL